MRWKQHERKCEICGNTYLFYQEPPRDPMEIPDSMLYGDHPSRCPDCQPRESVIDAPNEAPVEDEIRSHLDAMKEEVEEKVQEPEGIPSHPVDNEKVGLTPGEEKVKGYPSTDGGQGEV